MKRSLLFVLILNLLGGAAVLADEPAATTQPANDQQPVMTYDVSDLLRNTQDYPLSMSLWSQNDADQSSNAPPANSPSGNGAQPFNGSAPNPSGPAHDLNKITMESLSEVIKQITQQSDLNITHLGKMLIVQAAPDIQQKIQGLLNSMHNQNAEESRMICTRVFWLSLSPSEVASIFDKASSAANGEKSMPEIPDGMIDASHLYSQALTTCFSGQVVYIVAGRSQSYISNLIPVVGSNAVGLTPEISKALSGATLQIKPQLVSDGKATIDLASVVNESAQPEKELTESNVSGKPTTRPNGTANNSLTVESVNVLEQEFHTTVRMPLGKKILIGGMTLEPAAKDQAGRQLFLAMEVDAVQ